MKTLKDKTTTTPDKDSSDLSLLHLDDLHACSADGERSVVAACSS
jgi:hypothetical protein